MDPAAQTHSHHQVLLILDAGSQYGKVIDRRIRELGVETELLPLETTPAFIRDNAKYKAIIISGGPQSVYEADAPRFDPAILRLGLPVLGICYGMQLLSFHSGNKVEKKTHREDGQFEIQVDTSSLLFDGMASNQHVLLTHGDSVSELNAPWKVTSRSGGVVSSMENVESKLYGVQFHPEVDLTENGKEMFSNFLFKIAKLSPNYTMADRKDIAIKQIQKAAGDNNKVLVLVSGGVDSAVCAALLAKALPHDRIYALHIDNGFMRKDESKNVIEALSRVGLKIHHVDASQHFFSGTTTLNNGSKTKRLDETTEPEEKRKIIGDTFVHVAQREIEKLGLKFDEVLLAQGTLRPDLIESASHTVSTKAAVIKTHHNDTNLIRELRSAGRVLEPLSEYHKDEVRALGRDLGLPDDLVQRQPFPGPGLSVRIICTEKGYMDASFDETNRLLGLFLSNPEHADLAGLLHELRPEEKETLHQIARQKDATRAFILPMRTVGVQGDGRSYKYLCALSGACPENPRWSDLMFLAKLIPKIFQNINRLVYVFGPQVTTPPPTAAVTTHLTPDVIRLLQEADDTANRELIRTGQLQKVAQVPIILFPVGFDSVAEQNRSIAIRTLITLDFMTGRPAVPGKDIDGGVLLNLARQIKEKLPSISRVVYDLTSKPPATTEWE